MTDALVVGGSSRIGVAIGQALAALGHRVLLWGRDRDRVATAVDEIGGSTLGQVVDVTDRTALQAAAEQVAAGPRLAAVVWAAGLFDWADAD